MSVAELRITYEPDDDWLGELHATVQSAGFSGHGSAWFDKANVKATFVSALRAFPLELSNLPIIDGGFGRNEKRGKPAQCHLRIAVSPKNSRGILLVRVNLSKPVWNTPDEDLQQTLTVRFLTEYAPLERFSLELEQVLDGGREAAILWGSDGRS